LLEIQKHRWKTTTIAPKISKSIENKKRERMKMTMRERKNEENKPPGSVALFLPEG